MFRECEKGRDLLGNIMEGCIIMEIICGFLLGNINVEFIIMGIICDNWYIYLECIYPWFYIYLD